ncbi:2-amino-4-hydroxy-6-hydroxymethyldihydropteridine diphosphokinase [Rhodoblastus sp.]|uniref:2-amino-4-hydroxy-6- hydroxymethyldihydropteridine diphosphokinase n=1 Tax=Rhodoblastus sp. TaxID=1962975 RepID=UPI003F959AD6
MSAPEFSRQETRQESRIGLGLGANLGDPEENLRRAVAALRDAGVAFDALSSLYATPPWGVTDQPDFVNACALARTSLAPLDLLDLLKATERALGREETRRWGPRIIDIDLLFYDDLNWRDESLVLPHPGLLQRAFVLVPLAEIAPDLRIGGARLAEAARRVDAGGIRRLTRFFA